MMTTPEPTDATPRQPRLLLRHPPGLIRVQQEQLERLLRAALAEQQELATSHEHVCACGELVSDERGFWVDDRAGAAVDVESRLREAPLSDGEVARIGCQICETLLQTSYRAGEPARPHGALRPVCIFDDGRSVRISDFGIAAALNEAIAPGAAQEELDLLAPYVARELWLNPGTAGELRDLFAVGVMLYELATGRHPYGANRQDYSDCEQRVLMGNARPADEANPQLGATLAALLDRAVAKQEDERFPSLQALRDALLPVAGAAGAAEPALLDVALTEIELAPEQLQAGGGAAAATSIQQFVERFVRSAAVLRGLVDAERVVVDVALPGFSDGVPARCEAACGLRVAEVTAEPITLQLLLVREGQRVRVADPTTAAQRVGDALAAPLLGRQRGMLARVVAPLRNGPFPEARVEAALEQPASAALVGIRCDRSRSFEFPLLWDAVALEWREREPGALAAATITAAGEALCEQLRQALVRPSRVLAGHERHLHFELTPAGASARGGLPAELPFHVKLSYVVEAGDGTVAGVSRQGTLLAAFEATFPLAQPKLLVKPARQAEKRLGELLPKAAAGGAASQSGQQSGGSDGDRRGLMIAGAAVLAVAVVALGAWVFWPHGNERNGPRPDFDTAVAALRAHWEERRHEGREELSKELDAFLKEFEARRSELTLPQQNRFRPIEQWRKNLTSYIRDWDRAQDAGTAILKKEYLTSAQRAWDTPEVRAALAAVEQQLASAGSGGHERTDDGEESGDGGGQLSGGGSEASEDVRRNRQEFDRADTALGEKVKPGGDDDPDTSRDAVEQFVQQFGKVENDLSDDQRKRLDEAREWQKKLEEYKRHLADAQAASSLDERVKSLEQAVAAWVVPATQARRDALAERARRIELAREKLEQMDEYGAAHFIALAGADLEGLGETDPDLPKLIETARGELVKQWLDELRPALSDVRAWAEAHPQPPEDWRAHLSSLDDAVAARGLLDKVGSEAGLLRDGDLAAADLAALRVLQSWTHASLPLSADQTIELVCIPGNEDEAVEPFWLGRYEVTVAQYEAVRQKLPEATSEECAAENETAAQQQVALPVNFVEQDEAREFCSALMTQLGDVRVGLPEVAEWNRALFCGRERLADAWPAARNYNDAGEMSLDPAQANFLSLECDDPIARMSAKVHDGFASRAHVGSYAANRWDVSDLLGNVAEWMGDKRETRGGGFRDTAALDAVTPSTDVLRGSPVEPQEDAGFRVVVRVQ